MNLIERVKTSIAAIVTHQDIGIYARHYLQDCTEFLQLVKELNDNLTATQTRCTQLIQSQRASALSRDDRQKRVVEWARSTFGDVAMLRKERVMRFIEEAIELAQAECLSAVEVDSITTHVYGKPTGDSQKKVGGVGVTLLAYCEVAGISADLEETTEIGRVMSIDKDVFRARQKAKSDAGIAVKI